MKFVKLAIVLLPPCSGQYPTLLQRGFAGIKMLERLILTLQRAGFNTITILHYHYTFRVLFRKLLIYIMYLKRQKKLGL